MSFRIAIVDKEKCKSDKCNQECKKKCPVNATGKQCVTATKTKKASISDALCIGCNICTKVCPFSAITIVNLPTELKDELVHEFGDNGFKLYKLPIPKKDNVIGIIGDNGLGKSVILNILSNNFEADNIKNNKLDLNIVLKKYLKDVTKMKLSYKMQNITIFQEKYKNYLANDIINFSKEFSSYYSILDINMLLNKKVIELSGGELQRLNIYITITTDADIYIFDEPSNYLDIKQRINVSKAIQLLSSSNKDKYIYIVDHDLAVMDCVSDYVYILYGQSSKYGIVSNIMTSSQGINTFLSGYLPSENIMFRNTELSFKINKDDELMDKELTSLHSYPNITKTFDNFKLTVSTGKFSQSEITVLLGENGTGKTTFVKLLCGMLNPDDNVQIPQLFVSYKPQLLNPTFNGTVEELFNEKIREAYSNTNFNQDVIRPLDICNLLDKKVKTLSGGELQLVGIVLCLGKPADVYFIDEPSENLDCSKRVSVAKVIRRFIVNSKKSCFVVEHDLLMIMYLADKVLLFDGIPGTSATINSPMSVYDGINNFLKSINTTMRREINSYRPRFNKLNSVKDKEQKECGKYLFND